MDQIQKILIKANRKDLAQEYYVKLAAKKKLKKNTIDQIILDLDNEIDKMPVYKNFLKTLEKDINLVETSNAKGNYIESDVERKVEKVLSNAFDKTLNGIKKELKKITF